MRFRTFWELSPAERAVQCVYWASIVVVATFTVPIVLAIRFLDRRVADSIAGWVCDDRRWFNRLDRRTR